MLSALRGKLFVARVDREMKKQERSPFRSGYTPKNLVTVNGIDIVMEIDGHGVKHLLTAFDANDRLEYLLPEETEDKVIDVTFRDVS